MRSANRIEDCGRIVEFDSDVADSKCGIHIRNLSRKVNIMNMDSVEGFVDLDRLENVSAASGEAEERSISILVSVIVSGAAVSASAAVSIKYC